MPSQRRELANKLIGQVLTLSLQMYGCRVIQKVKLFNSSVLKSLFLFAKGYLLLLRRLVYIV